MISYSADILDLRTNEVRRTPMWVGWTEHSPLIYRTTMCDCNLAGYRERGFASSSSGEWTFTQTAHEMSAFDWRNGNGGCDHSMPPARLKVLKAYLSDGRVYDFESGEYEQEVAV